jgi:hypothetical protein
VSATTSFAPADRIARERGAILLLALVFMLMLALIVSSVMHSAVLQLHMSGNDQFVEQASNTAQAVAAELSLNADNFRLDTKVGQSNCPRGVTGADCVVNLLSVTEPTDLPAGVELDYRVTRQEPLIYVGFPVRESEYAASSSNSFDAALFEINVRFDGAPKKLGSSHVVQGIAVRVPANR